MQVAHEQHHGWHMQLAPLYRSGRSCMSECALKIGLKISECEEVSTCVRQRRSECEVRSFGWRMFDIMLRSCLNMYQKLKC